MSEYTLEQIDITPGDGIATWTRVAAKAPPEEARGAVDALAAKGYPPGRIIVRTTDDGGLSVLGTDGGGGVTTCDGCGAKPDRWRASYKTTASGTCVLRGREAVRLNVKPAHPHSTVTARCPHCGHVVNAYT